MINTDRNNDCTILGTNAYVIRLFLNYCKSYDFCSTEEKRNTLMNLINAYSSRLFKDAYYNMITILEEGKINILYSRYKPDLFHKQRLYNIYLDPNTLEGNYINQGSTYNHCKMIKSTIIFSPYTDYCYKESSDQEYNNLMQRILPTFDLNIESLKGVMYLITIENPNDPKKPILYFTKFLHTLYNLYDLENQTLLLEQIDNAELKLSHSNSYDDFMHFYNLINNNIGHIDFVVIKHLTNKNNLGTKLLGRKLNEFLASNSSDNKPNNRIFTSIFFKYLAIELYREYEKNSTKVKSLEILIFKILNHLNKQNKTLELNNSELFQNLIVNNLDILETSTCYELINEIIDFNALKDCKELIRKREIHINNSPLERKMSKLSNNVWNKSYEYALQNGLFAIKYESDYIYNFLHDNKNKDKKTLVTTFKKMLQERDYGNTCLEGFICPMHLTKRVKTPYNLLTELLKFTDGDLELFSSLITQLPTIDNLTKKAINSLKENYHFARTSVKAETNIYLERFEKSTYIIQNSMVTELIDALKEISDYKEYCYKMYKENRPKHNMLNLTGAHDVTKRKFTDIIIQTSKGFERNL